MAVVAIVGVDGCGKTTQAKMLVDSLRKGGYDAVCVEPVFLLLRFLAKSQYENLLSLLSPRRERTSTAAREQGEFLPMTRILMGILGYLYALITYLLISSQSSGRRIVVCDRFFFQFFFDLYGESADSIVEAFPKPDITFVMNGDLDCLYERMRSPSDIATGREYYLQVKSLLERISRRHGFIHIDAEEDRDVVGRRLLSHITNELGDDSMDNLQPTKVVLTVVDSGNETDRFLRSLERSHKHLLEEAVSLAERNGLDEVFLRRMSSAGLNLGQQDKRKLEENRQKKLTIQRTIVLLNEVSESQGIRHVIIKMPYCIPHIPRDVDVFVPYEDRDLMIESLIESGMKVEYSSSAETTLRKEGYAKVDIYSRICYFEFDFLDDSFFSRSRMDHLLFDTPCPVLDETASFILQLLHCLFGHRSLTLLDFLDLKLLEDSIEDVERCRQVVREYGWEPLFNLAVDWMKNLRVSVYESGDDVPFPHLVSQDFVLHCISTIEGLSLSVSQRAFLRFSLLLDEWSLRLQGTELYDALRATPRVRRAVNDMAHSVRMLRGDSKGP